MTDFFMFHRARIKLTLWYLLIIMTVSVSFSTVIYTMINREFERFARSQRFKIEQQLQKESAIERFRIQNETPPPPIMDPELIKETRQRLIWNLVIINGLICILSSALGYLLAGKTLRPIQTMIDEQNQFITDASHEFRTPLTSMKSAIEVALRDAKKTVKDTNIVLEDNLKDIGKLQSLSDQLLALAQFQKPNGNAVMKHVSLESCVKTAIHHVEGLRKAKTITIKQSSVDGNILGHEHEIIDCLVILLDNAIKYSAANDTVTISIQKKHSAFECIVKDNGIGIAKKDLPHIFDRFFRSDEARTKKGAGGYGLGLAIAKKIVERHNGTIDVESTLGKGSAFILRFPVIS